MIYSIISCSKDNKDNPEQLPKLTTNGLGTFGCMVDSEVWLPRKLRVPLSGSLPELDVIYSNQFGNLTIMARREYNSSIKYENIKLEADSVFNTGNYIFKRFDDGLIDPPSTYFERVSNRDNRLFYLSYSSNNLNIIYLDTISKIISGTFEMDFFDSIDNNRIIVTKGVFDLKYIKP